MFEFRFDCKRAVSPSGDQEKKIRVAGWHSGTNCYSKVHTIEEVLYNGTKHEKLPLSNISNMQKECVIDPEKGYSEVLGGGVPLGLWIPYAIADHVQLHFLRARPH